MEKHHNKMEKYQVYIVTLIFASLIFLVGFLQGFFEYEKWWIIFVIMAVIIIFLGILSKK